MVITLELMLLWVHEDLLGVADVVVVVVVGEFVEDVEIGPAVGAVRTVNSKRRDKNWPM